MATADLQDRVSQLMSMPFTMPEVKTGSPVAYYKNGQKTARGSDIAFVVKVNGNRRSVMLRTADGIIKMGVRHVSDPKLEIGPDHREDGAWDFTEDHIENKRIRDELLKRVKELERVVANLVAGKDQPTIVAWQVLRKEASELGIENYQSLKKSELEEAIAEAKKEKLRK